MKSLHQISAPPTPKVSARRKKISASGSRKKLRKGVCQFCGCTEHRACVLGYDTSALFNVRFSGDFRYTAITCSWWNDDKTVCNKASCVEAYEKRRAA